MEYPKAAWERAMKVQEVMMKAMSGEMTWIEAADVLGMSPRSLRRWRDRYERHGYDGLLDRRRGTPSPRRVPFAEVQKIVRLYREKYAGFNVCHFLEIARRQVRGRDLAEQDVLQFTGAQGGFVGHVRARGVKGECGLGTSL